jgi:hypothetical protein
MRVLKVVLSANILVAFVHLLGITGAPAIEVYAQWGAPLTVIGAGIFWAYIVAHRRRTMMRDQMLDESAAIQKLWADQHRTDQKRYRSTYQTIVDSPEMQSLREQIAVRHAIEQIATHSQITFDEAATIYHEMQARQREQDRRRVTHPDWTSEPLPGRTLDSTRSLPPGAGRPNPRWSGNVLLNPQDFTDEEVRQLEVLRRTPNQNAQSH